MADRIQFRRDTAARWSQYNPILLEGEIGVVTDNPNQYKIGDGINTWNSLPLRGFDGTLVHELGTSETAAMSQQGVTNVALTKGLISYASSSYDVSDAILLLRVFGSYGDYTLQAFNNEGNNVIIYKWDGDSFERLSFTSSSAKYVNGTIYYWESNGICLLVDFSKTEKTFGTGYRIENTLNAECFIPNSISSDKYAFMYRVNEDTCPSITGSDITFYAGSSLSLKKGDFYTFIEDTVINFPQSAGVLFIVTIDWDTKEVKVKSWLAEGYIPENEYIIAFIYQNSYCLIDSPLYKLNGRLIKQGIGDDELEINYRLIMDYFNNILFKSENLAAWIETGYISASGTLVLAKNGNPVTTGYTVAIVPIKEGQTLISNSDYQRVAALYDKELNYIADSLITSENAIKSITGTSKSAFAAFSFTNALRTKQVVIEGTSIDSEKDYYPYNPINKYLATTPYDGGMYVKTKDYNYLDIIYAIKYLKLKSGYTYKNEITLQRVPIKGETTDPSFVFYVWDRETGEQITSLRYRADLLGTYITDDILYINTDDIELIFDHSCLNRTETLGVGGKKLDMVLTPLSYESQSNKEFTGRSYCSLGASTSTMSWHSQATQSLGFTHTTLGLGGASWKMQTDSYQDYDYQELGAGSTNVMMNQVAKLFKMNADNGYYPDVITFLCGLNDCYTPLVGTYEDAKNADLSNFMKLFAWYRSSNTPIIVYTKDLTGSDGKVYDKDGSEIGTINSINTNLSCTIDGETYSNYSRNTAVDIVSDTAPVDWFTEANEDYRLSSTVNMRAGIEFVSRKFPLSQIIVITYQKVAHSAFNQIALETFYEVQKSICNLFSFPIIDFWNECGLSSDAGIIGVFSNDLLHPNTQGTILWKNFMVTKLKATVAFRKDIS